MKAIKLTWTQVSFLYNNLEITAEARDWYKDFDDRCAEYYEFDSKEKFTVFFEPRIAAKFLEDMKLNAEELLRQIKMDVFYGTLNDTSTHNTMWCLGMTSDIIKAIKEN